MIYLNNNIIKFHFIDLFDNIYCSLCFDGVINEIH